MSVTINGRPLTDLVYEVLVVEGHLAPAVPRPTLIGLANAAPVFGASVTMDARTLTIEVDLWPASLAARLTSLDTLAYRVGGGRLVEIGFEDDTTRQCVGALTEMPRVTYNPAGAAFAHPRVCVTLTFTCPDPARRDVEPLLYALSATATEIPCGTLTMAPTVWLFGASTAVVDPVVIVRDHTGTEVQRLTFSVSLGADTYLVFDAATHMVSNYSAGVVQTGSTAGLGTVASGVFPVLDPADGSPDLAAWATVELTSTSGTPTGALAVSRRW